MKEEKEQRALNVVGTMTWDHKSLIGFVTVNGERCPLAKVVTGFDEKRFEEVREFSIPVAADFNPSNCIRLTADTLDELKVEVEQYPYRLICYRSY